MIALLLRPNLAVYVLERKSHAAALVAPTYFVDM